MGPAQLWSVVFVAVVLWNVPAEHSKSVRSELLPDLSIESKLSALYQRFQWASPQKENINNKSQTSKKQQTNILRNFIQSFVAQVLHSNESNSGTAGRSRNTIENCIIICGYQPKSTYAWDFCIILRMRSSNFLKWKGREKRKEWNAESTFGWCTVWHFGFDSFHVATVTVIQQLGRFKQAVTISRGRVVNREGNLLRDE